MYFIKLKKSNDKEFEIYILRIDYKDAKFTKINGINQNHRKV